jgi:hypothetical protein
VLQLQIYSSKCNIDLISNLLLVQAILLLVSPHLSAARVHLSPWLCLSGHSDHLRHSRLVLTPLPERFRYRPISFAVLANL